MEAYKLRFINEYKQLKDRVNKLDNMLCKYSAGDLEFEPTCPNYLLEDQLNVMTEYLNILEKRAMFEDIEL